MRSFGPSARRREDGHSRRSAATDRRPRRRPPGPARPAGPGAAGPPPPRLPSPRRPLRRLRPGRGGDGVRGTAHGPVLDRAPLSPPRARAGGARDLARLPVGLLPPAGFAAAVPARQRRLRAALRHRRGGHRQPVVRRGAHAVPGHLRRRRSRGRPRPAGHAGQPLRGDRAPFRSARARRRLGARGRPGRPRRAGLLAGHAPAHLGRRHPHRAQQRGRAPRRPELQPSARAALAHDRDRASTTTPRPTA